MVNIPRASHDGLVAYFSGVCAEEGVVPNAAALDQLPSHARIALSIMALRIFIRVVEDDLKPIIEEMVDSNGAAHLILTPTLIALFERRSDDQIFTELNTAAASFVSAGGQPPAAALVRHATPQIFQTAGIVNSSGYLRVVASVMKSELGAITLNLDSFFDRLFTLPEGLREAKSKWFKGLCDKGIFSISESKWTTWPEDTTEKNVKAWLRGLSDAAKVFLCELPNLQPNLDLRLEYFISHDTSSSRHLIDIQTQSDQSKRKPDIAFLSASNTQFRGEWDRVMIPIELKSNTKADGQESFYDLVKYAAKVFNNQPMRSSVLGLTVCGPILRVWHFDRLGSIGSRPIDITDNPQLFLEVFLGLHCMSRQAIGFHPSICEINGDHPPYITVPNEPRRFLLQTLVKPPNGIVTRAATIWKGHFEGETAIRILKQSWQPRERQEAELLQHAGEQGLGNVARMSHHWTVLDIHTDVRRDVDLSAGDVFFPSEAPQFREANFSADSSTSRKRSFREAFSSDASSSKRAKHQVNNTNRVLQRIILTDVGKPLYCAESPALLLQYMIQCIQGHRRLFNAGILHRDISIFNLMINEDQGDPNARAFIIDLDHAIWLRRTVPSGLSHRTGTLAFMSGRILRGNDQLQHFLEDDLESFFWVLYWVCTHYDGPGPFHERIVGEHDGWYSYAHAILANHKGMIVDKSESRLYERRHWTPYYDCLFDCFDRFAQVLGSQMAKRCNDVGMYDRVLEVLSACHDELQGRGL